jgi:septal ring factor EnvC (AmiA/AmiB activator)
LAHETIASVGKSGGMADPGLYFEIRQAGNPIDPLKWIQKQG